MERLPLLSSLLVWESILQATKRERGHQPSYKTFDLQSVLPAKYARAMVTQNWEQPTVF